MLGQINHFIKHSAHLRSYSFNGLALETNRDTAVFQEFESTLVDVFYWTKLNVSNTRRETKIRL